MGSDYNRHDHYSYRKRKLSSTRPRTNKTTSATDGAEEEEKQQYVYGTVDAEGRI